MRNTVVLNGLETHRLNLKKPVDVLVREFLSKFHDRFVSKSVVKYIIKQHLPHLTIPKHSDHDSASCGIHHSGDLFLKSFLKTEKLIDPNLSLSELASLACCEKPGKVLNCETRVRKFMRFVRFRAHFRRGRRAHLVIIALRGGYPTQKSFPRLGFYIIFGPKLVHGGRMSQL